MKKITAILLIGITTLFFTGCGGDGASDYVEDILVDDVLDGSETDVILVEELPEGYCNQFYEPEYDVDGDRYYILELENDSGDAFAECTYHPNDQLMVLKFCETDDDNIEECFYADFYSDGTPGETSYTINGVLNGSYVEHYPTGEVQIEGEYVDGEKHGTFTVYKAPGVLHAVEEWENGVRIDVEYFNI